MNAIEVYLLSKVLYIIPMQAEANVFIGKQLAYIAQQFMVNSIMFPVVIYLMIFLHLFFVYFSAKKCSPYETKT